MDYRLIEPPFCLRFSFFSELIMSRDQICYINCRGGLLGTILRILHTQFVDCTGIYCKLNGIKTFFLSLNQAKNIPLLEENTTEYSLLSYH